MVSIVCSEYDLRFTKEYTLASKSSAIFLVHSEKWEHLTIKTKLKIDDSFCMFSILLEAKYFGEWKFLYQN